MPDPRLIPGALVSIGLILLIGLPAVYVTAFGARGLAVLLYQFGLR